MKVAAFTGGVTVPSARFRVRQYIPALQSQGIDVEEFGHSGGDNHPPATKWRRPAWGLTRTAGLAGDIWRSRNHDCVLLQREMISSFKTLEGWTGKPRVFDVDDSIHFFRGGRAARRIAQISDRVIAGNSFLADWYSQWNNDVVILPTAVDDDRYCPAPEMPRKSTVVGWIGSSSNFVYLDAIQPALSRVLQMYPQAHLRVIADCPPALDLIPPSRWSFSNWRADQEIAEIQNMAIGIMPLLDTILARGKCSFKMLQYMSCGIPVVVSPVGMNASVLGMGTIGLGASSADDWVDALGALITSPNTRASMGLAGRDVICRSFSVRSLALELAKHLSL